MKLPMEQKEWTLPSGMKVILIRKPDYAKSLFMIGIPAGGMNLQEKGRKWRSGSAHFLEHQMFQLHGEDVTPLLANMQAASNAYTGYTETCYFFATTANPLPPLKVLIDFVQNLDIDTQSVEKEKGIILSEYNIYDNAPENRLLKSAFRAMYRNHPFKEDILGTPEDIQNMSVLDLTDFYNTYYDPSQLVLLGITGLELDPIFDFIQKQEASYPCKVPGEHKRVFPMEPAEVVRPKTKIHMDVERPYALLAAKLQPEGTVLDNLKKDYMINLWLDATFSMMNPDFQKWLDDHIITQNCGAEADFTEDHAYLLFYSQTDLPEEFLELVRNLLRHPAPVSQEAFEALQIQNIASSLRTADDFDALASATIRGYFGKYDPWSELEIIKSTTLEEVNAFAAKLDFSQQAEVLIFPKEEDAAQELRHPAAKEHIGS